MSLIKELHRKAWSNYDDFTGVLKMLTDHGADYDIRYVQTFAMAANIGSKNMALSKVPVLKSKSTLLFFFDFFRGDYSDLYRRQYRH